MKIYTEKSLQWVDLIGHSAHRMSVRIAEDNLTDTCIIVATFVAEDYTWLSENRIFIWNGEPEEPTTEYTDWNKDPTVEKTLAIAIKKLSLKVK